MKPERWIVLTGLAILIYWLWNRYVWPFWMTDLRDEMPVHPTARYARRELAAIDKIVLHHSGGPVDQTPFQIATYHVESGNHICPSGCPGVAYHIIIDRAGKAYWVNDLENISYHATPVNGSSIGLCLIGNYNELQPTAKQLRRIKTTVAWLSTRVGKKLPVVGHKHVGSTATTCPGHNVNTALV